MWRLFGWLTTIYLAMGLVVVVFLGATTGFVQPVNHIDWSIVPNHVAAPLWLSTSLYWLIALVLVTALGPVAFFRRASRGQATSLLISYSVGTLVIVALIIGAPTYLLFAGAVPTSEHSWVIFTGADVIGSAIVSAPLLVPALAALIAIRLPANHRPRLTDDARDG